MSWTIEIKIIVSLIHGVKERKFKLQGSKFEFGSKKRI